LQRQNIGVEAAQDFRQGDALTTESSMNAIAEETMVAART
jgi:hypothetical protein